MLHCNQWQHGAGEKAPRRYRYFSGVVAVCLLLALLVFPTTVQAAESGVASLHITAQLDENGNALVTEVWDIDAASDISEWYVVKSQMGGMEIAGLTVSENGQPFETLAEWDVMSGMDKAEARVRKAGKCGIVYTGDGYELCWGVGSPGQHTFTVQYSMTNLVQAYDGADVIAFDFVDGIDNRIGEVTITINSPDKPFTDTNTRVWAGGSSGLEGEIWVRNNQVEATTIRSLPAEGRFSVVVGFNKGMFSPVLQVNQNFDDFVKEVLEGSSYEETGAGGEYEGGSSRRYRQDGGLSRFGFLLPFAGVAAAIVVAVGSAAAHKSGMHKRALQKQYKEAPYYRDLPYSGQLPPSYSRLKELGQLENEGAIIGTYMLRWIRSGQVQLVKQQGGAFRGKEEDALQLNRQNIGMEPMEFSLYGMLLAAAGPDGILQSKEFEKWSKKNYQRVQGWLEQYDNAGKQGLREMGTLETRRDKALGFIPYTHEVPSAHGEELTMQMFGFKNYLQDFTIINERQAREVQLWDEYLVYAQLFGIADAVAQQFKQLYPDYFRQMATQMGYQNPDLFDIYILTRISRGYSHAMYSGYRSGFTAAQARAHSGGGGGFSGGGGFGGGGFSGGGGGGGR